MNNNCKQNMNINDHQCDENNNKLLLIVRKAQEGKTFICIKAIVQDTSKNIHIVVHMNTHSAGSQFTSRTECIIDPKKMIVLNSNKKTAGCCHHAKNAGDVIKLITSSKDCKVIMCCAHSTRYKETLDDIFTLANGSVYFVNNKINFVIHFDEAHKYIPQYRDNIRHFNNLPIINKIILYTASPDPIFITDREDDIFSSILVFDVEKEYGIIRSTEYFGVKDCNFRIIEEEIKDSELVDRYGDLFNVIPEKIEKYTIKKKHLETFVYTPRNFYNENFPFSHGNEKLMFCYLEHVLSNNNIVQNVFSYHFIPAYFRQVSQYQVADIILSHNKNANCIVINGQGFQLFRLIENELLLVKKGDVSLLEPSLIIENLIVDTQECPTFITGYISVGMSVTLINEKLGNFDTVIFNHDHLLREDLYQLCRFLFNYSQWSSKNKDKIKKTNFISLYKNVINIVLGYEEFVEKLITDYAGRYISMNELRNIEIIQPTDTQVRRFELDRINVDWSWKRFEVEYEEDSDLQMERAKAYYKKQSGDEITTRSCPSPDINKPDFLSCSFTSSKRIHTVDEIEKSINNNTNWDSHFYLTKNKTRYASRLYIGYNDLNDPTKYIIYIKSAILNNCPEVLNIINKYVQNKDVDNPVVKSNKICFLSSKIQEFKIDGVIINTKKFTDVVNRLYDKIGNKELIIKESPNKIFLPEEYDSLEKKSGYTKNSKFNFYVRGIDNNKQIINIKKIIEILKYKHTIELTIKLKNNELYIIDNIVN